METTNILPKLEIQKTKRVIVPVSERNRIKFFDINRITTEKHIKVILESVKLHGITRDIVFVQDKDGNLWVAEGQHLVKGLMRYDIEIEGRIMDCEKASATRLMIDLNNNSKAWNLMNYINSEAISGNKQYQKLLAIEKKTDIQVTTLLMAYTQKTRGAATKMVRNGTFTIENKKRGDEIVEMVLACSKYLPNTRQVNEMLIKLILKTDNYDNNKMLRNLKTAKNAGQGTKEKEIFLQLNDIYNK